MGEPFDLGVDGSDRLVGELFGGTSEGAHALINSSVTLEAGMLGLESSVKWRGTTRFEQRRLRCRESTPDAYRGRAATGRIAVTWIALPGPSSAYGQPRRAMANRRGGASPARPWQCTAAGRGPRGSGRPLTSPCGLPRPRRGLLQERARLPGQPARPGGSARARRGAARRRPDVRAEEPWVEDATAVASSGRQPHPDLLRQVPPTGSTVAMRLRLGLARLLSEGVGGRHKAQRGESRRA